MIGNLKSTIHLEALAIAKGKILEHLKGKVRLIKFLYNKDELTESEVKRINSEDEHIRQVLGFVDDAEYTIKVIQEETQLLRERCEALEKQKQLYLESAAMWKHEYLESLQSYQNLIAAFERVNTKNEAA